MTKNPIMAGFLAVLTIFVLLLPGCIKTPAQFPSPSPTKPYTTTLPPTSTTKPTSSTPRSPTSTPPKVPTFELKELHSGISTPTDISDSPYKKFFFTYLTNLDQGLFRMKFIAPDGYFRAPFLGKGSGEQKDEASIPAQDALDTRENKFLSDAGYVALPGTYKMVVYNSGYPKTEILWEKSITYKGAGLAVEEASVNKWSWVWSWPVCEFFSKEISVTVSNKGDLPSFASVLLRLDGKEIGLVGLGYVDAESIRTFTFPSPFYMAILNYKNPGDTIPPSQHNFSVDLVSRIPTSGEVKETENRPALSTLSEYYNSPKCPYKSLSLSTDGASGFLLLDEYSTTVETPTVQTR